MGLAFFFGFFVMVFILSRKAAKEKGSNQMCCHIASILAVCCVLVAIYNVSLRTEAGYMAYFVLALPFVGRKGASKDSEEQMVGDGEPLDANAGAVEE